MSFFFEQNIMFMMYVPQKSHQRLGMQIYANLVCPSPLAELHLPGHAIRVHPDPRVKLSHIVKQHLTFLSAAWKSFFWKSEKIKKKLTVLFSSIETYVNSWAIQNLGHPPPGVQQKTLGQITKKTLRSMSVWAFLLCCFSPQEKYISMYMYMYVYMYIYIYT